MAEYWNFQDDKHTRLDDVLRIAYEYAPGEKTTPLRQRPFTAAENAAADAELVRGVTHTNRTTIVNAATTALETNRTFQAVASPTAAQLSAQVKALTRQNNALIRLVLNKLDGTD